MKFSKLAWYDMKNGYRYSYKILLIIMILISWFCIDFYNKKRLYFGTDVVVPLGSVLDYMMFIFGGMKPYIPSPTEPFIFPIRWLFVHMLIFYGTLNYPYYDFTKLGGNILPRVHSKRKWWLSKYLWSSNFVIICYLESLCVIGIFVLLMEKELSFELTDMFVNTIFDGNSPFTTYEGSLVFDILVLPLVMSVALNVLQITLELFVKPIFSFLIICIILLLSAYFYTPMLFGNYMMPIRSDAILEDGMQIQQGIFFACILGLSCFIAGAIRLKKYDMIQLDN